jgi:hypothetical protein
MRGIYTDVLTPEQVKIKNQEYALSLRGRAVKLWHRAKYRTGGCDVTVEWIIEKLEANQCDLTGLPFDLTPTTGKYQNNPYAPSLDRIDSSIKTYTPENTRVVLAAVNTALNQYGTQTMLPILKAMVKAIENPDANR